VPVTVTNCVPSVDGNDPIDVYGPNRVIQWEIVSSGYTFDQKYGILIKDDPGDEFADPAPQGKKFAWRDKNRKAEPKPFAYGINVRDSNGQLCHSIDPGIINHG
jgi:hypothetical protein